MFLSNLEDFPMWPQSWPYYFLTFLCQGLWGLSTVKLFDVLTIDILYITGNFEHSFDIWIFDFLLKPPVCITPIFVLHRIEWVDASLR